MDRQTDSVCLITFSNSCFVNLPTFTKPLPENEVKPQTSPNNNTSFVNTGEIKTKSIKMKDVGMLRPKKYANKVGMVLTQEINIQHRTKN